MPGEGARRVGLAVNGWIDMDGIALARAPVRTSDSDRFEFRSLAARTPARVSPG